jgi:hypothetical protein
MKNKKPNCQKCGWSVGNQKICYRVGFPYTQWMNENGNCKHFLKRWSFKHICNIIASA